MIGRIRFDRSALQQAQMLLQVAAVLPDHQSVQLLELRTELDAA